MNLSPEDARKKKLEAQAQVLFSRAMTNRENKAKEQDVEGNQHRRDFVLSKNHYFIQQPSEWDTSHFELGQEIRVADGAFDVQSHVTVAVDDVPELLDQIADYHVMPRYTDLLSIVDGLKDLYTKEEPSAGIPEYHIFDKIKEILEGRNV